MKLQDFAKFKKRIHVRQIKIVQLITSALVEFVNQLRILLPLAGEKIKAFVNPLSLSTACMTLAERFARLHKEALALQVLFAQLQKKG